MDGISPGSAGSVWVELTEHAQYTYAPVSGPEGGEHEDPAWTPLSGSEGRACTGTQAMRRWSGKIAATGTPIRLVRNTACLPVSFGWDGIMRPGISILTPPQVRDDDSHTEGGRYVQASRPGYAVKYAGVPVIEGSGKYNPDYKVYTFVGGDCANFASQVLQAGGLKRRLRVALHF